MEREILTNKGAKYFNIKIVPIIDAGNEFEGKIIILNDITDYKIKVWELKKEKEDAETGSKIKNEFLANISHEIRTSVNGIIGMTDLTLMTNLNSEQKENLNLVKSSALSLLDMTNSILDFSKIQSGNIKLDSVEFNFKELIDEIVRLTAIKALESKLEFKAKIDESIPDTLIGDPIRIKQILDNLIANSIKFTKYGTISLIIEKIESADKKVNLKFLVRDTGIGIDRKDIPKLFTGFSQIDNKEYTRKNFGPGLGLSICKGLVEMMDGKIEVKSRKDVGSVFSFNIYLEKGKKYSSTNISDKKAKVQTNNLVGRRLNILIVEDDKASQMVIYNLFKKNGHTSDIANNGEEALKLIENKKYDLILMDIQMPILDGIQTTKIIRKSEENNDSRTPIIALTAYALKEDKEKFLNAGMDNYISKPFNIDELLKMVYSTVKTDTGNTSYFMNKQNSMDGDSLFLYLL
ncbi:response regulator [Clostridium aciditolerans]|uniref:Circadian input-output histidine kinase CikA n=2 Tax=Clostridium aciditolerans TaxID=339861 RepID=A0A934HXL6_9CLOT|nr:response regulator [Clostridium aciditolerans]